MFNATLVVIGASIVFAWTVMIIKFLTLQESYNDLLRTNDRLSRKIDDLCDELTIQKDSVKILKRENVAYKIEIENAHHNITLVTDSLSKYIKKV